MRCFEFKEMLATSAEALAKRLLDQIRGSMRASSVKINEEYQVRGQGAGGSWGDEVSQGVPGVEGLPSARRSCFHKACCAHHCAHVACHTFAGLTPLPSVNLPHPAAVLPHDRMPANPSPLAVPRPLALLPPSLPLRS